MSNMPFSSEEGARNAANASANGPGNGQDDTRGAPGAEHPQLSGQVGLRVVHTGNLMLAPAGREQAESVGELDGGLRFARSQPRLQTDVDYRVQGLFFKSFKDLNNVYHQLNANSRVALVTDRFFLDMFGLYDQTIVDPTATVSFSNIANASNGNLTNVGVLGAEPNVSLDFGANVTGEVRYGYTRLNYDDPTLLDADQATAHFGLGNSKVRSGIAWSVDYRSQRYTYSQARPVELADFEGDLGYWVTPAVRVFITQGLESDYLQPTTGHLENRSWYGGADWRPDVRTDVRASFGQRKFGRARRFDLNRDLPYGTVSISYSEDPDTLLGSQLGTARRVGELSPFDTLEGPNIDNRVFVEKRYDVGLVLNRPKSDVSLRAFRERRFDVINGQSISDQASEDLRGTEVGLRWDLNVATSLSATARRARRYSDVTVINDTLYLYDVDVIRRIARQEELTFSISRQNSVPGSVLAVVGASRDYSETEITVEFRRRFGREAVMLPQPVSSGLGGAGLGLR